MFKNSIYLLLFFTLLFAKTAFASPSLIRDAETERFLYNLSTPIFKAANLDVKNIQIYIINDNSINAFVSGGQNIFINTGLIRKFSTPDALIGVIAHETGHIAAGHLARAGENAKKAERAMMLSYLLGIGAALSGSVDAAQGIIIGGSQSSQRLYMKFTRSQEEAADKHAIEYLDKISYPIGGLVSLLEFFESEMIGYKDQIDEYLLSHPISQKRIDLIKNRTKNDKFSNKTLNSRLQKQMDYVLAKLEGFIDEPNSILEKYRHRNDVMSNYKKSIAFFRAGRLKESINLIDKVIAQEKNSGFLYETKGQILFESGQIQESILNYDQAIKLLDEKDSSLAKISFASAILKLNTSDRELINLAIKNLKEAQKFEKETPIIFEELAKGYEKIGDYGRSYLALAEFNAMIDKKDNARKYIKKAKKSLKKSNKKELLELDDLAQILKNDEEDKKTPKDKEKEKNLKNP